jgi:hypothetical protein
MLLEKSSPPHGCQEDDDIWCDSRVEMSAIHSAPPPPIQLHLNWIQLIHRHCQILRNCLAYSLCNSNIRELILKFAFVALSFLKIYQNNCDITARHLSFSQDVRGARNVWTIGWKGGGGNGLAPPPPTNPLEGHIALSRQRFRGSPYVISILSSCEQISIRKWPEFFAVVSYGTIPPSKVKKHSPYLSLSLSLLCVASTVYLYYM